MTATRSVSIWLANDEGLYNATIELANSVVSKSDLADEIKSYIGNLWEESGANNGLFGDLMNSALTDVDWDDVAGDFEEYLDAEDDED